jgi:hypothetical protein
LFDGFIGTTHASDFSSTCEKDARPWAFSANSATFADLEEISQLLCKRLPDMPGVFRPRKTDASLALTQCTVLPSASPNGIGVLNV